uniref:Portal protein n=1 Tax=viral metagenome TaxID=1070528 RepID=A0A6M3K6I3_9ZZZZ
MEDTNVKEVEKVPYSEVEIKYRDHLIRLMEKARDVRDGTHEEFDGQTFKQWYDSNKRAANSYIPPKVNKEDVRTTSGTTHEKKITILNALLNYNLEPDIEAFDEEDRLVHELGTIQEDLIKKSRKLETPEYDDKRPFIYDDLLNQGTKAVEDTFIEYSVPSKELQKGFDTSDLKSMKWENRLKKVYKRCETNPLTLMDVYLGNFTEPHIQKQPFVFTRRMVHKNETKSIYGGWERYKYIPENIKLDPNEDATYNDWALKELEKDYVEEIKFQDKWGNNFMILLNGVMMFPVEEYEGSYSTMPLSALRGICEYNIAWTILEPIAGCAYGKSIPSKTKVDQAVFDEMMKMVIIKTRKSYKPPIANLTGKTLSKRIFEAGYIQDGVRPDQIQEIGTNMGVTAPEFNATAFIKGIIDEKSVSPIMEGQEPNKKATARQIVEQKQQGMMKMGLSILAVISLERQLSTLRMHSIMKNWTEAVDKRMIKLKDGLKEVDSYRTVSVDTKLDDGEEGIREIRFTEEQKEPSQIKAEEELVSKIRGKKYRIHYINPKVYKNLNYTFYTEITPTEKNTSELKTAMFEEYMDKSIQIGMATGRMPNLDYLLTRHALLNNEDPDKVWQRPEQPQMPPQMGGMQGGQPQGMPQAQPKQTQQPSLNAMLNG